MPDPQKKTETPAPAVTPVVPTASVPPPAPTPTVIGAAPSAALVPEPPTPKHRVTAEWSAGDTKAKIEKPTDPILKRLEEQGIKVYAQHFIEGRVKSGKHITAEKCRILMQRALAGEAVSL